MSRFMGLRIEDDSEEDEFTAIVKAAKAKGNPKGTSQARLWEDRLINPTPFQVAADRRRRPRRGPSRRAAPTRRSATLLPLQPIPIRLPPPQRATEATAEEWAALEGKGWTKPSPHRIRRPNEEGDEDEELHRALAASRITAEEEAMVAKVREATTRHWDVSW